MGEDPVCEFQYGFEAGLLGHELGDALDILRETFFIVRNDDNNPQSEERDAVVEELDAACEAIYARNLTPETAAQAVLALFAAIPYVGYEAYQGDALYRARQMTAAAARGAVRKAAGSAAWAEFTPNVAAIDRPARAAEPVEMEAKSP